MSKKVLVETTVIIAYSVSLCSNLSVYLREQSSGPPQLPKSVDTQALADTFFVLFCVGLVFQDTFFSV